MLYITILGTQKFFMDTAQITFLARTFILGAITFVVFFLILKTMERHYTRKKIVSLIQNKWEKLLYGETTVVVKNGVLQLDKLNTAGITSQQLFDALRRKDINHLNNVKRLYVNQYREFTIRENNALPVSLRLQANLAESALKQTNHN